MENSTAYNIKSSTCLVALIDALGYRNKLQEVTRYFSFRKYIDCIHDIKNALDPCTFFKSDADEITKSLYNDIKYYFFSDTAIIILPIQADLIVRQFGFMCFSLSEACFSGLLNGMLFRGAIALGEVLLNDSPIAFAGPAVNECALHYESANWSSIHFCPSLNKYINDTQSTKDLFEPKRIICNASIPFTVKTGIDVKSHSFALDWIGTQAMFDKEKVFKARPDIIDYIESADINDQKNAVTMGILRLLKQHTHSEKSTHCMEKIQNTIRALGYEQEWQVID